MTRLLTTVAVSALILSVAAPGLRAADTPSAGAPSISTSPTQAQPTQAQPTQAQTTPAPATQAPMNQAQTTQPPAAAPAAQPQQVAQKAPVHRTWHRQDHMANELNREELARLSANNTSYGSSR